jgi:hypothetical protein
MDISNTTTKQASTDPYNRTTLLLADLFHSFVLNFSYDLWSKTKFLQKMIWLVAASLSPSNGAMAWFVNFFLNKN